MLQETPHFSQRLKKPQAPPAPLATRVTSQAATAFFPPGRTLIFVEFKYALESWRGPLAFLRVPIAQLFPCNALQRFPDWLVGKIFVYGHPES
jgi:hypothetical protein